MPTEGGRTGRSPYLAVIAAMLVAAGVQAAIAARSDVIAHDGVAYLEIVRQLRDAPMFTLRNLEQHPGYPGLVLVGSGLLQSLGWSDPSTADLLAARLVSHLAGVLCVACIWQLTRRIFDSRVAAVAALLSAVWPLFRQNASDVLSDTPHLLFYLTATVAALEGLLRLPKLQSVGWFAVAGLSSGAAFLIRPEGLAVAAVGFGLMMLIVASRGWAARLIDSEGAASSSFARRALLMLPSLTALLVGVACCVGPYVATTQRFTSKLAPKLAAQPKPAPVEVTAPAPRSTIAIETTPSPGVAPAAPPGVASAPSAPVAVAPPSSPHVVVEPNGLLVEWQYGQTLHDERPLPDRWWLIPFAALREFCKETGAVYRYFLLIPFFAGVAALRTMRPLPCGIWLLCGLAACHFALLMVLYCLAGYLSHRHLIPMVATAVPTVAAGLVYLCSRGSTAAKENVVNVRLGWSLAVIAALLLGWRTVVPLNDGAQPLVAASEWVGSHANPGDELLASSQYVPYYSRLPGPVLGVHTTFAEAMSRPADRPWPFIVLEFDRRICGDEEAHLPGYVVAASFTDRRRGRFRVDVFRPALQVAQRAD